MADYPHFSLPFRFGPAVDGGLCAQECEQESVEEIGVCVEVILRTVVGQRSTLPEFGRPELEFNTNPALARDQLAQALLEWEPRVESLITDAPDPDDDSVQVVRALISPGDLEEGDQS